MEMIGTRAAQVSVPFLPAPNVPKASAAGNVIQ